MSSFSLFKIVNVVIPEAKPYLRFLASVTDAAAVNPSGIKTLLSNATSIFCINEKPTFINGLKSLPRSAANCTNLNSCVFGSFRLAD